MQQSDGPVGRPPSSALPHITNSLAQNPCAESFRGLTSRAIAPGLRCGGRMMLAARAASLGLRCGMAARGPAPTSSLAAFSTQPPTVPKPGFAPGAPPPPPPPPPGTPPAAKQPSAAAAAAAESATTAKTAAATAGGSASRSPPPSAPPAVPPGSRWTSALGWLIPLLGLPAMYLVYTYQQESDRAWAQKVERLVKEVKNWSVEDNLPKRKPAAPPPPQPPAPPAPKPPPPAAAAPPPLPSPPALAPAAAPKPVESVAVPPPAAAKKEEVPPPAAPAAAPPPSEQAEPAAVAEAAAADTAAAEAAVVILTATEAATKAEATVPPAAAEAAEAASKVVAAVEAAAAEDAQGTAAPAPPPPPTPAAPALAPTSPQVAVAAAEALAVLQTGAVPTAPLPSELPPGALGLEGRDLSPLGLVKHAVTSAGAAVADWSQWPERHAQAVADSKLVFEALTAVAKWHESRMQEVRSELEAERARSQQLQAAGQAAVASFKALLQQYQASAKEMVELEVAQAEKRTRLEAEKARLAEARLRGEALEQLRLALGALGLAHEERVRQAAAAQGGQALAAGAAAVAAAAESGAPLAPAAAALGGLAGSDPLVGSVVRTLPQGPVATRSELLQRFRSLRRDLAALSHLPQERAGILAVAVARLAAWLKADESRAVKVLGPEYGTGGVDAALARAESLLTEGDLAMAAEGLAAALHGTAAPALAEGWVEAVRQRAAVEASVAALNAHAAAAWAAQT